MLDFKAIKEIRIANVVSGKYGLQLRFRGDHAMAQCPLPGHKDNDKARNFSICISGNYWRCFSNSCNVSAGVKGGDVINFVALMENCGQKQAAQKLADWYAVGQTKTAPRMEKPSAQPTIKRPNQNCGTSRDSVKSGYMKDLEGWFDGVSVRQIDESVEDHRKRFLNAIKSKMVESYRAGQNSAAA